MTAGTTTAAMRAEQALELMRQAGNPRGEGDALVVLGELYRAGGQRRRALEYLDRALPLTRAANDIDGETRALGAAAAVHTDLGDASAALEGLQRAVTRSNDVDGPMRNVVHSLHTATSCHVASVRCTWGDGDA